LSGVQPLKHKVEYTGRELGREPLMSIDSEYENITVPALFIKTHEYRQPLEEVKVCPSEPGHSSTFMLYSFCNPDRVINFFPREGLVTVYPGFSVNYKKNASDIAQFKRVSTSF